ncbi:MAG: hypothetical protein Q7U18_04820 [Methylobacter sp.]|nr:hypothetical protein [Methylobacter sp.]
MPNISLQTAATLTEWSLSTLRRRLADGTLRCASSHPDKNKAMICFDSIKNDICIAVDADAIALIQRADTGDVGAQNDLAVLFLDNNKPQSAIYWLELAAKQNCADAMQLLGSCYLTGNGLAKDDNLAMMWVARAASLCHPIALAQMQSIRLLPDEDCA